MATKKRKPAKKATRRVTRRASAKPGKSRQRNKAASISEGDISKLSPAAQKQLRAQLGKVEEREEKAATPAQKKQAAKARRSFLSRLGTRLRVIGQTKTYKVTARDLGRAPKRIIKVRARHETDALAKAQSKLRGDYDQFRISNGVKNRTIIKARKAVVIAPNPSFQEMIAGRAGWKLQRFAEEVMTYARSSRKTTEGRMQLIDAGLNAGVQPPRLKRLLAKSIGQKTATRLVNMRVLQRGKRNPCGSGKKAAKRIVKKANPKASSKTRALVENFTGKKVRGVVAMNAPDGTPKNLAKLGKLVSISTEGGKITPGKGSTWLCADSKGKLHLCTSEPRLMDGPARSFGEVSQVEYETAKPHLGHKNPTIFFHKMGEDGGKRPTLHADGKGGLKFKGGSYRISREGIID